MRLNTLGCVALYGDDGTAVKPVLQQPMRLGLLIFLAVESRRGMVRRDAACGLFWPDSSQDAARKALSQALYFLRRHTHPNLIISQGTEEIALNPDVLSCDAVELEAAFRDRRYQDVARLAEAGEFMPGVFSKSGYPEFEHWMEGTRAEIRRLSAEAAWQHADNLRAAGDFLGAATAARLAARTLEHDETALRRLMQLLSDIGDRAGALRAYERFLSACARDLAGPASRATHALAEAIRDAGGKQDAVWTSDDGLPEPADAVAAALDAARTPAPLPEVTLETLDHAPSRTIPLSRRKPPRWASALVTVVVFVSVYSLWGTTRFDRNSDLLSAANTADVVVTAAKTIATDGAVEQLNAALPDRLIQELANATTLRVHGPNVIANVAESNTSGFRYSVQVGAQREGDSVRVAVLVTDAASNHLIGSGTFMRGVNTPVMIADVSREAAEFVHETVSSEMQTRKRILAHQSPRATSALQRAVASRMRADSLRTSPELARMALQHADSLAIVAVRSEPRWVDTHLERAEIALATFWTHLLDPNSNSQELRAALAVGLDASARAYEIDRDDPAVLELMGMIEYWLYRTMPTDSTAGAVTYANASQQHLAAATVTVPESPRAWTQLSSLYFLRGKFHESRYAAEQALRSDGYLKKALPVRTNLFQSAIETGDMKTAEKWCDDLKGRDGWMGAHCELTLLAWKPAIAAGDMQRASDLVTAGSNNASSAGEAAVLQGIHAVILAHASRIDDAKHILHKAQQDPAASQAWPDIAWGYIAAGDVAAAEQLLQAYDKTMPEVLTGIRMQRRFAPLRSLSAAGRTIVAAR